MSDLQLFEHIVHIVSRKGGDTPLQPRLLRPYFLSRGITITDYKLRKMLKALRDGGYLLYRPTTNAYHLNLANPFVAYIFGGHHAD